MVAYRGYELDLLSRDWGVCGSEFRVAVLVSVFLSFRFCQLFCRRFHEGIVGSLGSTLSECLPGSKTDKPSHLGLLPSGTGQTFSVSLHITLLPKHLAVLRLVAQDRVEVETPSSSRLGRVMQLHACPKHSTQALFKQCWWLCLTGVLKMLVQLVQVQVFLFIANAKSTCRS